MQHKFGIVSLSRAEQLLARSNHRREHEEQASYVSPRSPPSHQLNQAFIIKVIIGAGSHNFIRFLSPSLSQFFAIPVSTYL